MISIQLLFYENNIEKVINSMVKQPPSLGRALLYCRVGLFNYVDKINKITKWNK